MLTAAEKSRKIFVAFMDVNKYAMVIVDAFIVRWSLLVLTSE